MNPYTQHVFAAVGQLSRMVEGFNVSEDDPEVTLSGSVWSIAAGAAQFQQKLPPGAKWAYFSPGHLPSILQSEVTFSLACSASPLYS